MANLGRVFGGMLSGGGQGLQMISKSRLQKEKEKADRLHQESLARLQIQAVDTRQENQQSFQKERQEDEQSFRKDQATEKAGQVARTMDTFINGEPVTVSLDANNNQVGEPQPRGLSATEYKTQAGGEYDNPLHDDARKIINDQFATEVFADVLKPKIDEEGDVVEGGDTIDFFMIQNQLTGVKELNMSLVRAKYPEAAQKYDIIRMRVESELQRNPNPQQAVSTVMAQVKSETDAEIRRQHEELIKTIAEDSGAEVKDVADTFSEEFTPEKIQSLIDNYDPNKPEFKALKLARPEIYNEVAVTHRNLKAKQRRDAEKKELRESGRFRVNLPGDSPSFNRGLLPE